MAKRVHLRELLIKLGLNSAEYLKKLNTARQKTGGAARDIKRRLSSIQGGFNKAAGAAGRLARMAGLAAGAGGGGLALLVSRSATTQDQLAKTSQKLGVAVDDLVELRLAAERYSGMSETVFDTALQRQTRRVAEAAQGMGEAQDALKELGLDAQDLAKKSPDEQFRLIARAMAEIPNQGDRVRLSFKLFDTEGVALVNTLMAGEDGFINARREAEEFGLILSEIDSKALADAKKETDRLGDALEGAGNKMAVQVAAATQILAREFTELVTQMGSATEESNSLGRSVAFLGGLAIDIGKAWVSFFDIIVSGFDSFKFGIQLASAELYDLTGGRFGERLTLDMYNAGNAAKETFKTAAGELGNFFAGQFENAARLRAEYDALDQGRRNANALGGPAPANDNAVTQDPSGINPSRIYGAGEVGPQDDVDARITAEQTLYERRLGMQQNFVEQMLGLESGMIDDMVGLTQMLADSQEGITLDGAGKVAKGVLAIGSKLFGDSKAFGIAEAIVNTHRGITQALAAAPPPLSYALAAAVAAKGFASVRAISSAKKGSTAGAGGLSSGGGSAGGGSSLVAPNPQAQTASTANDNRVRKLVIDMPDTDRSFSQAEVRQIMNGIGELIEDDYTLEVRGISALERGAA